MMVDTGSETTLVTPEAARRLRLPPDRARRLLHGVGGMVSSSNAVLRQFTVGALETHDRSFSLATLPVHFSAQPPVAGLLGADVLAEFDIDFDVPHGRMALYRVGGCSAEGLDEHFMTVEHMEAVPTRRTEGGRLVLTAEVDGTNLTAVLDTGSTATIMTAQAAARLGVRPMTLIQDGIDTTHGLDMKDIAARRHRFASVRIGHEVFRDTSIEVADVHLGGPDMLLGLDYLRHRRVWMSYATGRMYVQAVRFAPGPLPGKSASQAALDPAAVTTLTR
jgi:predicted aspartyl protease